MPKKQSKFKKFYLSVINPYLDKKPFLKRVIRVFWVIYYRKLRVKFQRIDRYLDLDRIYWINPDKIVFAQKKDFDIYKYKGKVLSGDWDLQKNLVRFEETDIYRAFYQHFIESKNWEDTDFYQRVIDNINNGFIKWECKNKDDFDKRLVKIDKLYQNIKTAGFKTQEEIEEERIRKGVDEISVIISRHGDLIFNNGRHRLSIAKILKLDKIPIKVTLRHKKWIEHRKKIIGYMRKKENGEICQSLTHPDLSDIPFKQHLATKKRILMIEDVYLDAYNANAPKIHFLNLAREFSKLGFAIHALLPCPEKKLDFRIEELPFKITFTPRPFKNVPILRAFLRYFSQLPQITKQVLKKPDLIYIRLSHCTIIPYLWIKLIKVFIKAKDIKIVGELNGWIPDDWKARDLPLWRIVMVKKFLKWNLQLSDNLRVVAAGLKDIILSQIEIDPKRIFVVSNGTDIKLFRPMNKTEARKKIWIDPNLPVIGFAGNLWKLQGVEYLIKAVPIILNTMPNVQFLIVGDGSELKNLKQQAEQLGVSKKVIFTGQILYEKVPYYINSFDIATAPLIIEGNKRSGASSLKIYDYAACGIPVIASQTPGLEIIEKYNIGILVEPEKPQEIASVVIELLRDAQRRKIMGEKARRIAEKNFSWKKTAQGIVKYIQI